ncbi:MAG: glycosyltransferase family 2 protein [Bacteroidales bacterium]|nr:glycosyltransferase family 2 protein [Bacteroidales bacterium]
MAMLSVVIPVKDEADNIDKLVTRLQQALVGVPPWEVVFVDDGSLDATCQEIKRLSKQDDRIKLVRLRKNFGQSAALQAGFDHATGAIIVTMDGDLQNDPADIPAMLDKLDEGYDVVLGLRQKRQDGLLFRKMPSWAANWLIRQVTKVPFRDFGCTLRVMRREVVEGMALYGEMHRFITAYAVQQGARVTQVPVRHHPRTAGKSKYNLTRTIRVALDLLTFKFQASFETRPMHLFGVVGLLTMGLGIASFAGTLLMKYNGCDMSGNPLLLLSALLGLVGIQFLSLGLLGEMMARTYFESQGKSPYAVRETRGFGPQLQLDRSRAA